MAKTYNTLVIEVKEDISDIITAKQDDTQSRYLDVYLQDDGQPINLTGQEVKIYGRKADGTEFFNDGEITNATQGRCQFELTNQALAVAGNLALEISIWQNNERILTTQTFEVFVAPKIRNDTAIESSNEFGAVVVLYQKLYDFWLDIEKTLGKPSDTGGTTTAGTVMAKLNKLLTDIAQQGGNIQYKVSNTVRHTITDSIKVSNSDYFKKIYEFHAKYDGCIAASITCNSDYFARAVVVRSLHDYYNMSSSRYNQITITNPTIYISEVGSVFNLLSNFFDVDFMNLIYGDNTIDANSNYSSVVLKNTTIPVKKGEDVVFLVHSSKYTEFIDVTLQIKYDEVNLEQ